MIEVVIPESLQFEGGLRTTAERIVLALRSSGSDCKLTTLAELSSAAACHLFLNAYRCRQAIEETSARLESTVVVVITGTDLNEHLRDEPARNSILGMCDRIVLLHPAMLAKIPETLRSRATVIHQSSPEGHRLAEWIGSNGRRSKTFLSYVANIRSVKRPETLLQALQNLSSNAPCSVVHCGAVTEPAYRAWRTMTDRVHHYHWVGNQPNHVALRLLRHTRATIICSQSEGGSNVLSEATTLRTPVLSSDNECSVDLLGKDYPGLFRVGNWKTLSALMKNVVHSQMFFEELVEAAHPLRERLSHELEVTQWARVCEPDPSMRRLKPKGTTWST